MANEDTSTSLGAQLSGRRMELNRQGSEVAVAARISHSYYSAIEKGHRIPPPRTLNRIIDALIFSQEEANKLRELAAVERGLSSDDARLPDEVQALISDIRNSADSLPPRFIKGLRTKIREISD